MSLNARHNPETHIESPVKRRWVWRIMLAILLALFICLAVVWTQRLALIEMTARKNLAENNIEADFSLKRITGSGATIDDIRLSRNGETFFSAERVTADYNWREALNLNFENVDISQAAFDLEIDETGNIVSAWMPQTSGANQREFAIADLTVKNSRVNVKSPYGAAQVDVSAKITDLKDGQAQLRLEPANLTYGEFTGQLGGEFDVTLAGDLVTIRMDADMLQGAYGEISARDIGAAGTASLSLERRPLAIESDLTVKFRDISAPELTAGPGTLQWDGRAELPPQSGQRPILNGDWDVDIKAVKLTDPKRRDSLAETISLSSTVRSISSVAPFAPMLSNTAHDFLLGSDVSGAGRVDLSPNGLTIALSRSLTAAQSGKPAQSLTLSAPEDGVVVKTDPAAQDIIVTFDADIQGKISAALTGAELTAHAQSAGVSVQRFKANAKTRTAWQAKTASGKSVRLAPLSAAIDYRAEDDIRRVSLSGAITFNGEVPGGYVENAKARGQMSLALTETSNKAAFRPANGSRIQIARLETDTDWILEDLEFGMSSPGAPLYRRVGVRRDISAHLNAAQGTLVNKISGKYMTFDFDAAQIDGVIVNDVQNWTMDAQKTHMTSDSFPSPGTDVTAAQAQLTAKLSPKAPVEFTVTSPSADVITELVSGKTMRVKAFGQPDDMAVEFDQGLVKFAAGALPVLPLSGTARYNGHAWEGEAQTFLPRAEDTPIDVDFTFDDGIGAADVTFTDLTFKPGGLQPKQLVPGVSGMVSRVTGKVSSDIKVSFGTDAPLSSSGTLAVKDMSAATLPGPLSGMNAELSFSSFFPLKTDGPQTLTLGGFDPGFPLKDGIVSFEVIPDGVKLHSASWPMGQGTIELAPTTWLYSAPQNRVTLTVNNVQLGEFLKDMGNENFSATGEVTGTLPVIIEGVKVLVDGGRLSVKDGGVIRYQTAQTNAAGENNEIAGYAFDALKNFEYQELEAELNGPLDGPMKLRMKFDGSNPEVLAGSQFRFNIGIEGELLNIARSFQVGKTINAELLEQIKNTQASGD